MTKYPLMSSVLVSSLLLGGCQFEVPNQITVETKTSENISNENVSDDQSSNDQNSENTDLGDNQNIVNDLDASDQASGNDSSNSTDSEANQTDENTSDDVTATLASLSSPSIDQILSTELVVFKIANPAKNMWLDVGKVAGGESIYNQALSSTSISVNIPLSGASIFVTLWSEINGKWQKVEYVFQTKMSSQSTDDDADTGSNIDEGSDSSSSGNTNGNSDSSSGSDSQGGMAVGNQPALAKDLVVSMVANSKIEHQLLAKDLEGDELTYQMVSQPENGQITLDVNTGVFQYQVADVTPGTSSMFSYQVSDGFQLSNVASVLIRHTAYDGKTIQGRTDGIGSDLVIVGDGFTQNEQDQFDQVVSEYIDFMFDYEPEFAAHQAAWNIHQINLVSNESGADNTDGTNQVDTALDAHFNCGNIDRLLCVSTSKTFDVVNAVFPQWDNVLVIVNSEKYGGAGYSNGIGTASLSSSAKFVSLHEMAHSFSNLADEYTYGGKSAPTREPNDANVTINNNPQTVKWKHWWQEGEGEGKVGLFEGAVYTGTGVWRPTVTSIMRSNGKPFHAVNLESWTLHVYENGGVYFDKMPVNQTVQQMKGQDSQFAITTSLGGNAQSLVWKINGIEKPELKDKRQVKLGSLQQNDFTVSVEINDQTGTIRHDPQGYSSDTVQWSVEIK